MSKFFFIIPLFSSRSVLVLNGNGADVAKHCVPAVPAKRYLSKPYNVILVCLYRWLLFFTHVSICYNLFRISITFRRMDEFKRPVGYVAEPDLQGIQPLSYEADNTRRINASKPERFMKNQPFRRPVNVEARRSAAGSDTYIDRRESTWRGSAEGSDTYIDRRESTWNRQGPPNRWRVRKNVGN